MSKRILLIEDDLFVRELYEQIFKRRGYQISAVSDGSSGLTLAYSQSFDLLLLDIMLPGESGLEVLKQLKAKSSPVRKMPVFLLTNLGQESIIKEAFKLGADGYLLKARLLPNQIVSEVDLFFENQNKGNS